MPLMPPQALLSFSTLSFPQFSTVRTSLKPHNYKPLRFSVLRATNTNNGLNGNNSTTNSQELELLNKPSPVPITTEDSHSEDPNGSEKGVDDALAPFLKFFQDKDSDGEFSPMDKVSEGNVDREENHELDKGEKVNVEYYDPKPGDFVVGVVVSGNENKLDVNVGADMLGTMLTKEVLPLYDEELPYLLFDVEKNGGEVLKVSGKMGIVKDEEALEAQRVSGRPIVEVGTILFAEVLGRTLSGRPLLSTRRMFRRVAWQRVRQIKQLDEPFEVKIFEWNTGGLLTRIEGLRVFLPKAELMRRASTFTELKENVGRRIRVCISRIDEEKNDLIISEKQAWWVTAHIKHNRKRIESVRDVLKVDEKVKVLVLKSMFPDKISLSIADLESEPGLFLSNRERVFSEAEEMAKQYRKKLPVASRKIEPLPIDILPFDDEERLYANWKWFKFEQVAELDNNDNGSGS